MHVKILLVLMIALAVIACSGCLTETKQNEMQETLMQNSSQFMAFGLGFHGQENWFGTPTRWMQANATLLVNSSEDRTATLSFNALSFYRNRTLEISSGGVPADQATVPTSFINVSVPIHLAKGANTVQFYVSEGCESPSDIKELNSSDDRCLSVAVQNLSVT